MSAHMHRVPDATAGFVDVLTTENNGRVFGYRLTGATAGPCIVVAGSCGSAMPVFERLLSIPTLPWMRGSLVLVQLDRLDDIPADLGAITPLGPIDRTIMLPWGYAKAPDDLSIRRNYHLVLRACAGMGMIAGRGVSWR